MASAEQLRTTHRVEGKVMSVGERVQGVGDDVRDVGKRVEDVNDKVQGVNDGVQDVGDKVQGVDDGVKDVGHKVQDVDRKLDDTNRSSSPIPHTPIPYTPGVFTGNLLRDNLLRWLSPSDPSTNHNIASKAHHDGTAQWFFQGRIFKEWKSAGSFLWVHGKRAFLLTSALRNQSYSFRFRSGIWKEHSLVRSSSTVQSYLTFTANSAPPSYEIS